MKAIILSSLLAFLSGCNETSPQSIRVGGKIIKVSEEHYKIATLLNEKSEPNSIDAKLVDHTSIPTSFIKTPSSIQQSWKFETKECGYLFFYETLPGDILCLECGANAYSYKECPLDLRAIDTFILSTQKQGQDLY